jgi:molybdopterin converting factor small subunit
MPVVWIPSLMRNLTGGKETVTVSGNTIGQVIEELERQFPGIKSRLCDSGGLRRGIAVAVDTQVGRLGLAESVSEHSEVHFLPAVSGGQESIAS